MTKQYQAIKASIEKRHAVGKLATKTQVSKLATAGFGDEAYQYARRYGKITHDSSFTMVDDSPTGHYKAGDYRNMNIIYDGRTFEIEMYNGNVNSFGWKE